MAKLVVFSLLSLLFVTCASAFGASVREPPAASGNTGSSSTVKLEQGKPVLYVNGQKLGTVATEVFNIPDIQGVHDLPEYSSDLWLKRVNAILDEAHSRQVPLILIHFWWYEMDCSPSRPSSIARSLNFGPLDGLMNHARDKNVKVMLIANLQTFPARWWMKENNFPPHNVASKVCDFCETDSCGNIFANPSFRHEKVKQDFGEVVEAVVERYKGHPALAGWILGVGPTGEDFFGPSYIALSDSPGGNPGGIERKPLMYTDYSPFFQREFKEWLKQKYATDQAYQEVYGAGATLANATIPPADKLVKCTQTGTMCPAVFPDPSLGPLDFGVATLTAQGLDFYTFRNQMRKNERDHFINIIKGTDPDHVLLAQGNAINNDETLNDPKVDGFIFEPTVYIDGPVSMVSLMEDVGPIMGYVEKAISYKKILIVTETNFPSKQLYERTGKWESPQQIMYLEAYGKAVKCVGGILANSVDLKDRKSKDHYFPVWFSYESSEVFSKIVNYIPVDGNCARDIISDLYTSIGCNDIRNQPPSCGHVAMAFQKYCR